MISRRTFISAAVAAPFVPVGYAMAQSAKEDTAKQADFLFVQTSRGMTFDKSSNKLTLEDVSTTTLFFPTAPNASRGT